MSEITPNKTLDARGLQCGVHDLGAAAVEHRVSGNGEEDGVRVAHRASPCKAPRTARSNSSKPIVSTTAFPMRSRRM